MPRLGKRSVDGLAPAEKEYVIWDDELKGFGIRVRPSGAKTYVATYRHGRRFRWATIGKHGSPWTPESARLKANTILRAAGEGEDPAAGKSERRAAISVAELIDAYLAEGPVDKPNKRASTWSIDKSNLNRHVRVLLGTRIAAELTSTDLAEFQRDVTLGKSSRDEKTTKRGRAIIKGGAGTARRTLITLAAMLQWAVGRRIIRANPAKGVQLVKIGSRERFLTSGGTCRPSQHARRDAGGRNSQIAARSGNSPADLLRLPKDRNRGPTLDRDRLRSEGARPSRLALKERRQTSAAQFNGARRT